MRKEEKKITNGEVRQNLVVSCFIYIPLTIISLIFVFYVGQYGGVVAIFFVPIFLLFFTKIVLICYVSYNILVLNKKYLYSEFLDATSIFKKTYNDKQGTAIEGIISQKEKNLIDKDHDGYILISERYPLTEEEVLKKIIETDKEFSKLEFYDFVKRVFMLIQEAWIKKDYHKLRAFEADALYYRHKTSLEDEINNTGNDIKNVSYIKGILLKDFKVEGQKEFLTIMLTVRMRRYYLSKKTESDCPYVMIFSRNKEVKTKVNSKLSTTNCCNCGAAINVDDDGICNYCNTSLVSGKFEWVLVDMRRISLKGRMIRN